MRRIVLNVKFYATVIVVVLLLLCQFLFRTTFWGGGLCTTSLLAPNTPIPTNAYSSYTGTAFGFPLNFIMVSEDGCFNNRKTQIEWNFSFLLIDALLIGCIGALPYGIPSLWQRMRR
jgi:hypothetical protein